MMGASLPSYSSKKDKKTGQEVIRADDPRNKQRVQKFFNSVE